MTQAAGEGEGVCILGAGLAGLGCAREFPAARVFEASNHAGGHAYSHRLAGFHFDEGAHISHTKDHAFLQMISAQAGRVHSFEPSVVRSYWRGQWIGYPVQNHLRDLSNDDRIAALTDLVLAHVHDGDRPAPFNYRQWCERQYGTYVARNFYDVFTSKYWRHAADQLSTDWLSGRLIPSDIPNVIRGAFSADVKGQASFTRFHYPESGGFFGFFRPLYESVGIAFGRRVVEIDVRRSELRFADGSSSHYEDLATSIPLPDLVRAITDVPPSVSEAAERLRHTKLLCVNIVLKKPSITDLHWCYVYDHDIEASRLSFPGNLAPTPGAETCAIQAEIFRDHRESWSPVALVEQTVDQLGRLLGFDPAADVLAVEPLVVPYAYVISDHDRAPAVDHILSWLKSSRVFPMGLYGRWSYLWSDRAFESGRITASTVRDRRNL